MQKTQKPNNIPLSQEALNWVIIFYPTSHNSSHNIKSKAYTHKTQLLNIIVKEEVKNLELTERCVKYFLEHCYTSNRITVYKALWCNGIIRYMSQKGIESYSPSVGADIVSTCHFHGTVLSQEREKIRSIPCPWRGDCLHRKDDQTNGVILHWLEKIKFAKKLSVCQFSRKIEFKYLKANVISGWQSGWQSWRDCQPDCQLTNYRIFRLL